MESLGKKYQQLYWIGSRGLNFVWHCMYAKMFGLLPKAVGSHSIILNRRMICFRKVILVLRWSQQVYQGKVIRASRGLATHVRYDDSLPEGMKRSGQLWEDW